MSSYATNANGEGNARERRRRERTGSGNLEMNQPRVRESPAHLRDLKAFEKGRGRGERRRRSHLVLEGHAADEDPSRHGGRHPRDTHGLPLGGSRPVWRGRTLRPRRPAARSTWVLPLELHAATLVAVIMAFCRGLQTRVPTAGTLGYPFRRRRCWLESEGEAPSLRIRLLPSNISCSLPHTPQGPSYTSPHLTYPNSSPLASPSSVFTALPTPICKPSLLLFSPRDGQHRLL